MQEFKTEIKADSRPTSKADFLAPAESSINSAKPEANRLQEELSALLFAEEKEFEKKPSVSVVTPKQELADAAAKIPAIANEEPANAQLPSAPSKVEISSTPAVPTEARAPKSTFDTEEVKIPAWLEPLARNADVHAPEKEDANDAFNGSDEWQASDAPGLAPSRVAIVPD